MASGPVFEQPPDEPPSEGRGTPQPQKRGMSTATKVVLILACVFGGLFLLCCGGVIYFFWQVRKGFEVSDDPDTVAAVRREILDIELPPGYRPRQSFKMDIQIFNIQDIPKVKGVFYDTGKENGVLMLMEISNPEGGRPNPAQREQMRGR